MMNICVVGAGAIGGWVAARLAIGGQRVMALSSRGALERIELREGGGSEVAELARFDGPAELLIIAVKATALTSAVQSVSPMIGPRTLILPMLNGVPWWFVEGMQLNSVDPDGAVAAALPFEQLIGCVVHASCSRPAPGVVVVNHADKLILGEPNGGDSERVRQIGELFEAAGIRTELSDQVRRAIWYKLWGNATINPLSALTRATGGAILADPECRAWLLEGMAELAVVGAKIGCPINESGEDRLAVTARLGPFKTSMLQDVESGRAIELDALLGAPREIGRAKGIATPALDRLFGVTRLMADQGAAALPAS